MAEKAVAKKAARPRKTRDNVILVGRKPAMAYVLAVITQFTGGQKTVHVKARGRSISRAVDVVEIVRNRFASDAKVDSIAIGTEEREVEGGNKINVSTIDIALKK